MPRVTQGSGQLVFPFTYRTFTFSGQPFQSCSVRFLKPSAGPSTPRAVALGLGCSAFARHYSRNRFFSSGYSDVSLPLVPLSFEMYRSSRYGFPHSDTVGSPPAHDSPTLFAVYHVLLRLLTPRHPPFAFFHFSCHAETLRPFFMMNSFTIHHLALSSRLFRL